MKQKKVISLPTNEEKIYRQILAFMNFMLNLTPQERDILAEFIKLNNEFEALPPNKRIKFILSTDVRKDICTLLNLDAKQFNVVLSKLKKKKFGNKLIIDEYEGIHQDLCFKPDQDGFRFEINFVMTSVPQKQTGELTKEDLIDTAHYMNEKLTKKITQYPVTPEEAFPPTEYKHDASKAPIVEEEDWEIQINRPDE